MSSLRLPTPYDLEQHPADPLDDVKRLLIAQVKDFGVGDGIMVIPRRLTVEESTILRHWAMQSDWILHVTHGKETIGEHVFERSFVKLTKVNMSLAD